MATNIRKRAFGPLYRCLQHYFSSIGSTTPSAPPMLLKIRSDLKSAMKAKDANRLNVLRGLLADATNLAKASNPIRTDLQVLALLRKRAAASRSAVEEFSAAKRDDLKEKEEAQISVLEEYAAEVETVGAEELETGINKQIERMKDAGEKIDLVSLLRSVMREGGALHRRPVEMKELARSAKAAIVGISKA